MQALFLENFGSAFPGFDQRTEFKNYKIMANLINDTLVSKKLNITILESDASGGRTKTRTYNRINPAASKEDMYKAAAAIAGLMAQTVGGYYHSEKSLLQEVETEEGDA